MALTEVELRSLREIDASVRTSDPRLARCLAKGNFRPRTANVLTAVAGVLVFAALVVGVTLQLPIVCAVCWSLVILLSIVRGIAVNDPY